MLTGLTKLGARVRAFFSATVLDSDFEQELGSHLDMLTDDNIRRGMSPDLARRTARLSLGGTASLKEQVREARGLPALDSLLQDLRFAFRVMARDRWFSAAAILALALGIGANTIGFTIVNAAFFRGLPFDRAGRLHILSWQNRSGRRTNISPVEFENWRARTRTFTTLAAWADATLNISDDRALPEEASAALVSANAFRVLGRPPLIGRDFAAGEDQPGAEPVVMISYGLWNRRYGADPEVPGTPLRINGRSATIVGVMPAGMNFPDRTEVWAPLVPNQAESGTNPRPLRVFGRLRDGTSRSAAQAEMRGIAEQTRAGDPESTRDLIGVNVETFTERFIGGAGRPMFIAVMGAVSLVLLIACANVANMLLSRSAYRAREIAVRLALGATRWRVVRQLLIESAVFGLIGGSIGLALAVAGTRTFGAAAEGAGLPFWVVFTVDYVVFAYVAAICVLTAVLFGLAPALQVSKTNAHDVLKEGGRGSTGSQRVRRFGSVMVITELTLTMVLLVGAGLLVRSFFTLYSVDLGINIDSLMAMGVRLPEEQYQSPEARRAFFDRLEARLASIPGVEAAAVTNGVPPFDGGERLLQIDRPASTSDAEPTFVGTVTVSPRFFDVLGARLVRGRAFQAVDGAPGLETVIVNERLAAQFFPGEDPIGRRLRFAQRRPVPGQPLDIWRTIVGIAPLIKQGSADDGYVNAVVYLPYREESPAEVSLLVRSALAPAAVMASVRSEVQALDRDQPLLEIQTVAQLLAGDRWWYRTWGSLFAVLAAIALVLSATGLYAVTAYSVTQRTQEIGVRIAVGAQPRQVSWLVLKLGLWQLMIGLPLGLAGAFALNRLLGRALVDITPNPPATYVAIALLLTAVSVLACLLPVRRALRVDPVVALRVD